MAHMENARRSIARYDLFGIGWFLCSFVLLLGTPAAQGQQRSQLTTRFAKAALASLRAIESDTSIPQSKNGEAVQPSATPRTIDATGEMAVTPEEESIASMLRETYRLRLQDNDLLNAYGKLMEVEGADEPSDELATKRRKDFAVSQFADIEQTIMKREGDCFRQFGQSLLQRSSNTPEACSEWIQRAQTYGQRQVRSAATLAAHPVKP